MVLHMLIPRQTPATAPYDWILAITFIAYIFSAFGNGANDVANAYATSVAARTLTMPQVGVLSVITEFFGAVVSHLTAFFEWSRELLQILEAGPHPMDPVLQATHSQSLVPQKAFPTISGH